MVEFDPKEIVKNKLITFLMCECQGHDIFDDVVGLGLEGDDWDLMDARSCELYTEAERVWDAIDSIIYKAEIKMDVIDNE